ncbi:PEP-CTERM system histidine kinase PrsK [Neiella sp. HB171785]|uniref:histidine kinase n=1 Tax=Neiella litorisoli TaxID=2771431 RepID=A0A8J6QLS0_9GAMM|nr:XrtA/PEP-CTERM system histidine kinase PrsK [Neiella litorisoli]MBD1390521.1 PEP-CTERM system histidine kinase PrsK [Neiella litorisoli]
MSQLVGMWGYGLAALSFLFLFLLVLTTRQRSLPKSCLLLACGLTAIWSAIAALQLYNGMSLHLVLALDTLKNGVWLLLLTSALSESQRWRDLFTPLPRTIVAFVLVFTAIAELFQHQVDWMSASTFLTLHLVQPVLALWLIEHLYRQTLPEQKWAIKPLCLGLGMVFVFDFVLFSNAALAQSLPVEFWSVRGWLHTAATPLILLTARRSQHWSTRVFVSREIIFHSTLLMAAGGYLVLMALAGYYIRYMGGSWGGIAQIAFFALGGLVLASLFLSDRLRRRVKVFITKHFFANKYEYRDEWMKFADVFSHDVNSLPQVAIQAMAQPFASEQAILAVKTGKEFEVLAQIGSNQQANQQALHATINQVAPLVIQHDWILDVEELKSPDEHLPFELDSNTTAALEPYRLIVPLDKGAGVDAVCMLSQPQSSENIDWEDRDLMKVIARQLTVHLKLQQANMALAESQQFDTFNRMSAFLVHDLKNVLAQLQLLTRNAERHKHNPEFVDDAFATVEDASNRLNRMLEQLRQKRIEGENQRSFDAVTSIQAVVASCQARMPSPLFSTTVKSVVLTANQERFENVLSHLVQNAQDATPSNGTIELSLTTSSTELHISVKDTGLGMTQEFISTRLFKPFDTTKGNAGMGIGAYDAKKFVEQLQGHLTVTSEPGVGTEFVMTIPIQAN